MWQLNDNLQGTFRTGEYQVVVDLRHPEKGVQLTYNSQICDGLWLGAATPGRTASEQGELNPEAITDSYARGRDLIATYAQGLKRSVRPQIYWRASALDDYPDALSIELVLSVQSSQLESQPQFPVATTVPVLDDAQAVYTHKINWTGETSDPRLQTVSPTMFYWQMPVDGLWAAVMPHPGDNATLESGSNAFSGAFELSISLFPRSVEKGVIRRSRIQMLLAGGGICQSDAALLFSAAFEKWTSSAPPLTV